MDSTPHTLLYLLHSLTSAHLPCRTSPGLSSHYIHHGAILLRPSVQLHGLHVLLSKLPQLKINNRSFKLLRLLGEGGFSYVYLVQDKTTSELFALKKIRCPFGQESVSQALKEVEAYNLFNSQSNIIHSIDHCVSTESGSKFRSDGGDPGSKTVYILLPYYQRGNLQDAINANLVNHTKFPEKRLMVLILGVADALRSMHQYRVKSGAASTRKAKGVRREGEQADEERGMQMKPKRGLAIAWLRVRRMRRMSP
ncbi:unnamed protein product [Penicillium nalgiovense]|nr:unnamed protein product [Penicillium nalgiovense]